MTLLQAVALGAAVTVGLSLVQAIIRAAWAVWWGRRRPSLDAEPEAGGDDTMADMAGLLDALRRNQEALEALTRMERSMAPPQAPPPPPAPFDLPLASIRDLRIERTHDRFETTSWGDPEPTYVQGRVREEWRVEALEGPPGGAGIEAGVRIEGRRFDVLEASFTAAVGDLVTWSYRLAPAEPALEVNWERRVLRGASRRSVTETGVRAEGTHFTLPDQPAVPEVSGATYTSAVTGGEARVVTSQAVQAGSLVVSESGQPIGIALSAARAGEMVDVMISGMSAMRAAGAEAARAIDASAVEFERLAAQFQRIPRVIHAERVQRVPRARQGQPPKPEPTLRAKGRSLDFSDE